MKEEEYIDNCLFSIRQFFDGLIINPKMKKLFPLIAFLLLNITSFSQINFPRISPSCTLKQTIGLTDIIVEYSRPAVRSRKIMGELVPYGRIWRVGANESTKFSISDSCKINDHKVPAGTYALYAIPQKDEWTIIIHKITDHWGDGRTNYNPEEDQLRFTVIPEPLKDFQEAFTIEFNHFSHDAADMEWRWENTLIRFRIEVDTDAKVMAEIYRQIKENPTADTYYQSARYLQEEEKMPDQALVWLEKAHELAGDKYYIHRVWALVLAQKEEYKEAIIHARKSMEIADSLGKDEFVRMNQKSIEAWKEK